MQLTAHECWWGQPPANHILLQNDVHVWCASLDQSALKVKRLSRTLNAEERVRAERFYFDLDRKRFIVAHGLLRTILGYYSGIKPGQLEFRYSTQGKPSLAETSNGDNIRFNLARSHGQALFAFTLNREIGIDLESMHLILEAEVLFNHFFSKQEKVVFQTLVGHEKQEAFFRYWTCKEAYTKACGEGLAQPLNRIDISLVPGKPATLLSVNGDVQVTSRWSLQELKSATGFAAALVVEGHGYQLACWKWSEL